MVKCTSSFTSPPHPYHVTDSSIVQQMERQPQTRNHQTISPNPNHLQLPNPLHRFTPHNLSSPPLIPVRVLKDNSNRPRPSPQALVPENHPLNLRIPHHRRNRRLPLRHLGSSKSLQPRFHHSSKTPYKMVHAPPSPLRRRA